MENTEIPDFKLCTKCGENKPTSTGYHKDKKGKYGLQSACKTCKKKLCQQYCQINKEKIAKQKKEYRKRNAAAFSERDRSYREKNKEKIKAYMSLYQQKNKQSLKVKSRRRYDMNKEKYSQNHKIYYRENTEKIRQRTKEWYQENKEYAYERQKKYAIRNREKVVVAKRAYAQRRKEHISAYKKRYAEENKEEIRVKRRAYRKDNAELIKERKKRYEINNPHVKRASSARRRAAQKLLPKDFSPAEAKLLFERFDGCAISNLKDDIHLDHFISLSTGHGGTLIGNMIPISAYLNVSKNSYNPFLWIRNKDIATEINVNKWRITLRYLADLNDMTVKEYRDYVNYCYDNPISVGKVK